LGKREGCVYINKGTRYRKKIGSWEGRKRILKMKTMFWDLGKRFGEWIFTKLGRN
jgi:hypothetical protein